jgi:hypothetical protein
MSDDLAFRYAIEHGQTRLVRKYEREDAPARISRLVKRDELAAGSYSETPKMRNPAATLAELVAAAPCTGGHGDRMPVVCCQAADALEQPHPFEEECVDSEAYGPGCGGVTCVREGCPKHHDHRPPGEA